MRRKKIFVYIALVLALAIALTMLPLQFIHAIECGAPVIKNPGFKANMDRGDWWTMSGSIAGGYTLCTNGDSETNYYIQYAGDLTDDPIECAAHPLYLISSSTSPSALEAYYNARTTLPGDYRDYLIDAAYGDKPFAYVDGCDELLIDGAKYYLYWIKDDMTIPGDYPYGTYTVQGKVYDECEENYTTVTYTLIISSCLPGEDEEEEAVWVRTLPMTCSTVWINKDGCFEFVFFWEYKNNNWVKIYDMEGNEVFSIDMKYGNPRFEACLGEGMFMVKTYHDDMSEPLQEFAIGNP